MRRQVGALLRGDMTADSWRRRERIAKAWLMMRRQGGTPAMLIAAWARQLRPSTAESYTAILLSLLPPEERSLHARWGRIMRKRNPVGCRQAARPATPAEVRRLVQTATSEDMRLTIVLLWISASRHGDCKHMVPRMQEGVLALNMPSFKSDIYGKRSCVKFLLAGGALSAKLFDLVKNRRWTPYRQLLRHMHVQTPGLTVHSLRRGSATYLANQGVSFKDIALLTLHTPEQDEELAVRRYVDSSPKQTIPRAQRRMSQELLRSLQLMW